MGRIVRNSILSSFPKQTLSTTACAALLLSSNFCLVSSAFAKPATPTNTARKLLVTGTPHHLTSCHMSTTSTTTESPTSTLQVHQFPCLDDNYGYLLHDPTTGATAAIDTPDAKTYSSELKQRGWTLTHVWNTHHHWDHTGGNVELKADGDVNIWGPESEASKIPGLTQPVTGGDVLSFGSTEVQVINVGGHTLGHIAFYVPSQKILFPGDALFVLGCGRMFEGTAEQFWDSLKRLKELPPETKVFCAHEYTLSNAKFAVSVEPSNPDLQSLYAEIQSKRKQNVPTVPSTIGQELKTNPFLRIDVSEEVRRNVGVKEGVDDEATAFGRVRSAKDNFRG